MTGARGRRARWFLPWVALVGVAAVGGWWAGRAATEPPTVPGSSLETLTVAVEEGEVSRALTYAASASVPTSPVGVNGASGTLTTLDVSPGQQVGAGTVLYSVDLRQVVAAVGTVPAFRDLSVGSTGADVAQLETLLVTLGRLDAADEVFTPTTEAAVRAWQRDLGTGADGVVRRGDVVFLPQLPVVVLPEPSLVPGAVMTPGSAAVSAVTGSAEFVVTLGRDQAPLVPLSGPARVRATDGTTWDAVVAASTALPPDQVQLRLTAPDGGAVCGAACPVQVPVGQELLFTVDLLVVSEVSGPVVPAAAVLRTAGGDAVRVGGTLRPVRVLATADGVSAVSGVEVGEVVELLPGDG